MNDISADAYLARIAIVEAAAFIAAPHTRMRPRVFPDGTKWCALYGDDLMQGVSGFGDTPEQACTEFDKAWSSGLTPDAARARRES
jgi:hypothetical protein